MEHATVGAISSATFFVAFCGDFSLGVFMNNYKQ
jgi:hypothetical protein